MKYFILLLFLVMMSSCVTLDENVYIDNHTPAVSKVQRPYIIKRTQSGRELRIFKPQIIKPRIIKLE